MDTGTDMTEQSKRPLIQIDNLVREMTEEEYAELLILQSVPSIMTQAEPDAD
jgi:hypothetical protein